MARKTKQEAEETREKILTAALNIIHKKGYARTTFVDIAREIGLTKGAVYWHFKSKPEMFLALGRQMEERIEEMLRNLLDNTRTLMELNRALREMTLLMSEDEALRKYYTIVYYRMEWTEELMPIKAFFDRQDELMLEWIGEVLEQAGGGGEIPRNSHIPVLAKALYGIVGGLLAYCLSEESPNEVSRIVRAGLDIFFAGLSAHGADAE